MGAIPGTRRGLAPGGTNRVDDAGGHVSPLVWGKREPVLGPPL